MNKISPLILALITVSLLSVPAFAVCTEEQAVQTLEIRKLNEVRSVLEEAQQTLARRKQSVEQSILEAEAAISEPETPVEEPIEEPLNP